MTDARPCRALVLSALLFASCSSAKAAKDAGAASGAPRDAGRPAPAAPVDAGPAWEDTGKAPTAEDRAGPLRVHFRMREAIRLFARDYVFEGTADGGTWSRLERQRAGRGEVAKYWRSPLSAAEVAELLRDLDAAKWWAQADATLPGAAGTQMLDVQVGRTRHRFEVKGPCWCDNRCACEQARALDAANVFFHRLSTKNAEKPAPTALQVLAAPPPPELEDGGTPPRAVDCEVGPAKALACGKRRCVRQGKQAACFDAPDGGAEWVTVGRERKSRADFGPVWAFRTASGLGCVQRPYPGGRDPWVCDAEGPRVSRLFWVGKTLMLERQTPEWAVEPIAEAWR